MNGNRPSVLELNVGVQYPSGEYAWRLKVTVPTKEGEMLWKIAFSQDSRETSKICYGSPESVKAFVLAVARGPHWKHPEVECICFELRRLNSQTTLASWTISLPFGNLARELDNALSLLITK